MSGDWFARLFNRPTSRERAMEEELTTLTGQLQQIEQQLMERDAALAQLSAGLEQERRAHEGTRGRLEQTRRSLETTVGELARLSTLPLEELVPVGSMRQPLYPADTNDTTLSVSEDWLREQVKASGRG